YTFRAYFLTFWGEERIPPEAGHHAHESPPVMTVPLMVLAAGALFAGYVNAEPLTHWLGHFLERTPHLAGHAQAGEVSALGTTALMALSSVLALGGIAVAYVMYVRQPGMTGRLAERFQGFYQ